MRDYDDYNREERSLCAHLFRLLHENLDLKEESPLGQFIKLIFDKGIIDESVSYEDLTFQNVRIYSELAIIRDIYYDLKSDKERLGNFMDELVEHVSEGVGKECRPYTELNAFLNDPAQTHPRQFKDRLKKKNYGLDKNEVCVYSRVGELFSAKPDLLITVDNLLLICEAKLTMGFDKTQYERAERIGAFVEKYRYKDLGFISKPHFSIFRIGASSGKSKDNISWEEISQIADRTYDAEDRTRICLNKGVKIAR